MGNCGDAIFSANAEKLTLINTPTSTPEPIRPNFSKEDRMQTLYNLNKMIEVLNVIKTCYVKSLQYYNRFILRYFKPI